MGTTYDRFWALVDRSAGPGGCWPWKGPVNRDGVGVFTIRRRRTTARRYAYRMEWGDPGPLRVVVTCGRPECCNWRHLTARTAREVAVTNGSAAAVNAARNRCPRGHPRTDANLYTHPGDGRRECRACKLARAG